MAGGPDEPASTSLDDESDADTSAAPMRVLVVGGGCAGLAAAWEIASLPNHEVEVYERSWRLGGKGASGRSEDGRIREHGLHVWFGFYENAFRLMRECYAEAGERGWGPDATKPEERLAHGRIEDAFLEEPHIGVGWASRGEMASWAGFFPPEPGQPGTPLDEESNPYTLVSYVRRCIHLAQTLVLSTVGHPKPGPPITLNDVAKDPDVEESLREVARVVRATALTGVSALTIGFGWLLRCFEAMKPEKREAGKVLRLLTALTTIVRSQLKDVSAVDPQVATKMHVIEIVLAIAAGLWRGRLLMRKRGFDAINDRDYRDWLRANGASEDAVQSKFLEGIYELAFAFEGGDPAKPRFAAGVALRSALRMFFTYRGSMFWRLRSGMGDAVFAPLYKALCAGSPPKAARRRSPVKFRFGHALESIRLARSGRGIYVSELRFQAAGDPSALQSERASVLDHFGCWPEASNLRLDALQAVDLTICRHFDAVVFAMGIDDVRAVFGRAASSDGASAFALLPREWKTMALSTQTVATKAGQVWLDVDRRVLGWDHRPGVVTALGPPLQTFADMTHTLASERAWRSTHHPGVAEPKDRSVAYFCSVLPDATIGAHGFGKPRVEAELEALLERGSFLFSDVRTGLLANKSAWHVSINAIGSDRYTLSLPGTIHRRISPLDDALANAAVAGDWTSCGLDAGCVEAAVMSGLVAAHAITGAPAIESIVGFNHP